MTSQLWKHIAVSSALLALMLTASLAGAQIRAVKGLPGKRAGSSASQAPVQPSITADTPSYMFTLLSYPGQLYRRAQRNQPRRDNLQGRYRYKQDNAMGIRDTDEHVGLVA
jgi:hypothetical protein